MARTIYDVSPDGPDWTVKRRGAERSSNRFQRKADAVARGVELASASEPSQLIIRRADGTIEDERTYGNDPYPPPG